MSLSKNIVRYGVLTALVAGTATVVVGPDTMGALLQQTRDDVRDVAAKQVRDPVALRSQIRSLAQEYPKRIADVRGDLAELREQARQLTREREVSERVVGLAMDDLAQMQGLITRAESTQDSNPGHVVRVVFANESLDVKEAYTKAARVQQVQEAYSTRQVEIDRDMGYLQQQETRLVSLLDQLETENAQFQAQMWQLDRQIDSIQRNDRLITMMEKRQRTLDQHSTTRAHSLDQVATRFADIRAKQEARLDALSTTGTVTSYEDRAKVQIDGERSIRPLPTSMPNSFQSRTTRIAPRVIEISPADLARPLPAPLPASSSGPTPGQTATQAPSSTSAEGAQPHANGPVAMKTPS